MDVVALYKRAWTQLSDDLPGWVVLYLMFGLLVTISGGLAVVLMPNVHRELRDTRAEGRSPEVARLFNFDHIGTDAVAGLIFTAAIGLGSMAAGIGATAAAMLLVFLIPLAADNKHEPVDSAKVSVQHAMGHIAPHAMLLMGNSVLMMASLLTCGVGFILAVPLMGMANQLFYEESREELDEIARGLGLLTASDAGGGPPSPPSSPAPTELDHDA